jgi:hypothetical protein
MSIYEDTIREQPMRESWQGHFADNVPDFATRAWVIIPDLDPTLRVGPCRWQARDAVSLPAKGDACLVIFDNDREPWVVAWSPF